jgi:arsenate reductase
MKSKTTVLFIDRTNSDRSLIAEALLREHAGQHLDVYSAGIEPGEVSPLTRRALAEIGIRSEHLRSKGISEFLAKVPVTYAILLGHRDEPGCPKIYPFAGKTIRWECADPSSATGSHEERLVRVRQVREWLNERIREWAPSAVRHAA